MFQDAKYALKLWARRPCQTAFVVAALAIGIGANTGVFSVVNALLLRSLPFRDPERLALTRDFIPPHDTAKQFHEWSQHSAYLADAALFEEFDANLGEAHIASRAHVAQTSSNFFSVLGTEPVLGRAFTSEDDVDATGWGLPGRNAVAVINYGLWQRLYGANPGVLGTAIRLDGTLLRVVGVAPRGFDFPHGTLLWKPAAFSPGNNGWQTVARLKPGLSWAQARAALAVEAGRLLPRNEGPDDSHPGMISLQDALAGSAKDASVMFMGAVVLVLLIACANVANILTARTADRVSEFSIRSALGANNVRMARQLLTEGLVLSFAATLAGLVIAYWTTSLAANIEPPTLATQSYSILDARVLAFTVIVSIITTLMFSILPFLCLRRVQALGARGSSRPHASRLVREIMVGTQIALAIILLAGSVSLGRAFVGLMKIDRGYEVKHVVTASVSLDGTTHQMDKRQLSYFEQVLNRVRRLPGIRAASATEFLPLYASAFVGGPFGLDGRPAERSSTMIPVMAEYFQTMGTTILYGREFTDAEVHTGAKVALVNLRFAARFGAPADAIGHQLTNESESWKIVGVVKGMEYETDPTTAHGNEVFVPSTNPGSFFSTFVVRVNGRAEDRLAEIRDVIRSVDPQVPVFGVKTMEQRLDNTFASPKFYRIAISLFAGFALLLALMGIYGIVSYAVVQRRQELGVRLALGTTPARLRGMLLQHGLLVVAASAIPGTAGAQLSGRSLENLVDGAKPIGVGTLAGLILLLAVVASASIWSASRRIASFDIIAILRSE